MRIDEELIRVFMVDDDEDDYVLARDLLAESVGIRFQLEWTASYEEGLEAMMQPAHDAYLVDYRLGQRDGLELLRTAVVRGCSAPIIMLTGQGDREVDVAAMQAGAADYLDKGALSGPLLERTIRYAIERKRAEEQLIYLATHDALTGLPNRVLLADRLAMELARSRRNHQELAVMLLDLDHFKNVNDTLGHGIGDRLLQLVGERLTRLLRQSDTVARFGGDEFILLLPEITQAEDTDRIAQKALEAIRKPFVCEDYRLTLTASIGIALFPYDGEDLEALVRHADIAMFWAKRQGRDNWLRHPNDVGSRWLPPPRRGQTAMEASHSGAGMQEGTRKVYH